MTRWVAELGSSHNGDFDRAIALIDAAAAAGFSDVKTQQFHVERLFSPEALRARPELRERVRLEVPWEWHKPLANRCKEHGMGYGVTVFHADDVRRCALEADWLKVSSYSLLDEQLLRVLAMQPKPLAISTGMATEAEVSLALSCVSITALDGSKILHPELTLLHCVSSYPALPHEANLRSIPYMRERFGVPVGWSDHTVSTFVVGRAVAVYSASIVELHFDLDDIEGTEWKHSWRPSRIEALGRSPTRDLDAVFRAFVNDGHDAGGYYACDGKAGVKAPSVSEDSERAWRADPSDGMRPLLALRATL